jgi:DNA (cytosine-5)-methyltransferase 1
MKPIKILNLYACLGGNRYKWDEVADNLQITAVELDPEAARLYQERFPKDNVIVADAHKYLLDNYQYYDIIWSSPPCPTHSRMNFTFKNRFKIKYPDMTLYQQIIFLEHFFTGKYIVENVIPYYEPLIPAQKRGRHLYWTNFRLPTNINERKNPDFTRVSDIVKVMGEFHNYDFYKYKGKQSRAKMANNLVDYQAGKSILEAALGIIQKPKGNQKTLFEHI